MPAIEICRTIKTQPVNGEVYQVLDSHGNHHVVDLISGCKTLTLPSGRTVLGIRFSGGVGSEITLKIVTPSKPQNGRVKIPSGNLINTIRFFDV